VSRPPSPLPLPLPPADAVLTAELRRLYEDLEGDLAALGASCDECGECCRLDEYGHQLWLTGLELSYLLDCVAPRPPVEPGVCPYLVSGACTARSGRALSCRVFHCELPQEVQERIHEEYLERVAGLAAGAGWEPTYGELLASLEAVAADQTGSRPRTRE